MDADLQRLRFRHPLIRSAVAQSASLAERRRVHEALADVLHDQPDRRAWHRAALLSGEHEDVALELEAGGRTRARRRGAVAVAVTAMRRAAELGEPASRSRRLLAAAGLAVELGRPGCRGPLLQRGQPAGPRRAGPRTRSRGSRRPRSPARSTPTRFESLDRRRGAGRSGGRPRPARRSALARRLARLVGGSGSRGEAALIDAVATGSAMRTPRTRASFAVHAYADPLGHAAGVLARLRARRRRRARSTPTPRASSGRRRSSSARSTWAPTSWRRRSTACGRRDGSGICRGC